MAVEQSHPRQCETGSGVRRLNGSRRVRSVSFDAWREGCMTVKYGIFLLQADKRAIRHSPNA
eukprot:4005607-Alexandrium_andersonii.AAC.1